MNFLTGRITSGEWLDFDADPDHDPDLGILTEFLPLRDMANCKKFAGPAALAEVCDLRVLFLRGKMNRNSYNATTAKQCSLPTPLSTNTVTLNPLCTSLPAAMYIYAHCLFLLLFLSIISTAYHLLSGSRSGRKVAIKLIDWLDYITSQ